MPAFHDLAERLYARVLPMRSSLEACAVCVGLILLTTYIQYNATYFATYTESGVRRIALAERLRKLPLAFFGKKDLADLTSTIMADCTFLEQSFSHFIPELAGSILSCLLVAACLFFYDWRMALAALWVMPWPLPLSASPPGCRKGSIRNPWTPKWPARTAFRSASKRCRT